MDAGRDQAARCAEAHSLGTEDQSLLTSAATGRFICFTRAPADLHARINARVDEMFRRGLVGETEQLLRRGLAENQTAMQAIGYRQVVEHLRGERPLAATIELVKARTRQFARRQMTWFRRQADWTWVNLDSSESGEAVAVRLAASLNSRSPDDAAAR